MEKSAKLLSVYFRRLNKEFPYKDLPGYLKRNSVKEAILPDEEASKIVDGVVNELSPQLEFTIRNELQEGMVLGATQAHTVFRLEPTFSLLDDGAIEWMNLELYRKVLSPYENKKAIANGDVLPTMEQGID